MSSTPVDWRDLDPEQRLTLSLRSPAAFFVSGEDSIQLSAINSAAGVTLTLAGRFMQLNGEVTSFAHVLTPATDRTLSSILKFMGDGTLMNFSVIATSGAPLWGQCWVRVQIVRGLGGATMVIGALVSGYVTASQPVALPGGRMRGSLDGQGVIRAVTGTNPAAGANFSVTVPTGARWRLQSLDVSMVTSGTAANREMVLVIDDGTTILARVPQGTAQIASLTRTYSYYESASRNTIAQAGNFDAALPPIVLLAGSRIMSAVTNIEVDDDIGAPTLLVEEWLEGN